MNRRLLILIAFVGMACGGLAQTVSPPNEGSRLSHNASTGIYTLYWWGSSGNTYFVQHSEDLIHWIYFSDILPGANAILGENFQTNAERFYVRLKISPFPTTDPFNDDFDGDAISNQDELALSLDPLDADTDGDQLPDGWEIAWGLNPNHFDSPHTWLVGSGLTAKQLLERQAQRSEYGSLAWEARKRLHAAHATGPGGTHVISWQDWEGDADASATVLVLREVAEGVWQQVGSTTVAAGSFEAAPPPGAGAGAEANFKLGGGVTSCETATKVRLMMKTSGISRAQPGWNQPGTGQYFLRADWENGDGSTVSHWEKNTASREASMEETSTSTEGSVQHASKVSHFLFHAREEPWTWESTLRSVPADEDDGTLLWTTPYVVAKSVNAYSGRSVEYGGWVEWVGQDPEIHPWENYPAADADFSDEYTSATFFDETHGMMEPMLTAQGWSNLGGSAFDHSAAVRCYAEAPFSGNSQDDPQRHFFTEGTQVLCAMRYVREGNDWIELLKSQYWIECNDCEPGGAVAAVEIETLDGPPGAQTVKRIIALPIGGRPGLSTSTLLYASNFGSANGSNYLKPLPLEMKVDANRDGEISFDGTSTVDADQTTAAKPFRFWLNDDRDDSENSETIGSSTKDSDNMTIDTKRDLEDFTRLWINIGGLQDALSSGQINVGLEWKNVTAGSPSIRIYPAVETNGGGTYLTDDTTAGQQIAGTYGSAVASSSGHQQVDAQGLKLPGSFWSGLSSSNPNKHLIFEGKNEGKGQLVLAFYKSDGTKVGDGGSLWLDLKNVKKMYERAKVTSTPDPIAPPSDTAYPADDPPEPTMGWVQDPNGNPPDYSPASWQETKQYIVLVHGWNMTYQGSQNYAETMFKRLWQRGYKGRFARLYWPTLVGTFTYNDSEYRAWKCGESLKQFMASLPAGYTKNLISHSMGGIVCGSALQKGMIVTNYALCHAALPAACYDDSSTLDQGWGYTTPHYDPDAGTRNLSYRYKLNSAPGNLINFYLLADDALQKWEWNNDTPNGGRFPLVGSKPQLYGIGIDGYGYTPAAPVGSRLNLTKNGHMRWVNTPHEAMAYVAQSPTRTVGADGDTGGSIDGKVNLDGFNFGDVHSAEYNFTTQKTKPFFNRILEEFDIPFIP